MTEIRKATLYNEGAGEIPCMNQSHDGFVCTRVWQHRGDHHAHLDETGLLAKAWRGGKPYWPKK